MKKKVIGIITAIIVVIAALFVIYLVKNNQSKNSNINNDNAKEVSEEIINDKNNINQETKENNEAMNSNTENRILIAYFSRADENYNVGVVDVGNTEIMAGFIKDYFKDKADTFKIDPIVSYPTDYNECTEVATKEKNTNARPEFKGNIDLSKYDTIFIGYPIWWSDVPMIINTFIEKYDFTGKDVYLFNTHEGSGNSGTYTKLKNKLNTANVNTNGLAIQGKIARSSSSKSTVENWLKDLGF